jgi:hypothetical protein
MLGKLNDVKQSTYKENKTMRLVFYNCDISYSLFLILILIPNILLTGFNFNESLKCIWINMTFTLFKDDFSYSLVENWWVDLYILMFFSAQVPVFFTYSLILFLGNSGFQITKFCQLFEDNASCILCTN